jgi:hypothetical protein
MKSDFVIPNCGALSTKRLEKGFLNAAYDVMSTIGKMKKMWTDFILIEKS